VTNSIESLRSNEGYLSKYPETKRIYLKSGKFYNEGDVFKQPELAATFSRLQREGPNEFYQGLTARLIVDDMKRNNGLRRWTT
jgi:gamma-glutamyltranspeptidase/glutathione hydrolase